MSNDLFREAAKRGISSPGSWSPPTAGQRRPCGIYRVSYSVEIEGLATEEELGALVRHVDEIAEIPNSPRAGTEVRLENAIVRSRGEA